jgi:hypothetical protein
MVEIEYKETDRPIKSIKTKSMFGLKFEVHKNEHDWAVQAGSTLLIIANKDMKEFATYLNKMTNQ